MLAAAPAQACQVLSVDDPPSWQRERANARAAIRATDLIVDAEVIEAPAREANGYRPGRLRAVRVLKGPAQETYLLEVLSYCDVLAWTKPGERRRLFLTQHGEMWRDSERGGLPEVIDPMLKSNRYKPWPDGGPGERKP